MFLGSHAIDIGLVDRETFETDEANAFRGKVRFVFEILAEECFERLLLPHVERIVENGKIAAVCVIEFVKPVLHELRNASVVCLPIAVFVTIAETEEGSSIEYLHLDGIFEAADFWIVRDGMDGCAYGA